MNLRLYKVKQDDIIVTFGRPPYRLEKPEYIYWPQKKKAWMITGEGLIETDYRKLRKEKNKKLLGKKERLEFIIKLLEQHIQTKE